MSKYKILLSVVFLFVVAFFVGAQTNYQYFERNLTIGSRGTDVLRLQQFLNSDPNTTVATTGSGSPGNETEYFGNLTKSAVIKFQLKYNIEPPAGYFGPISRAKANSILSQRYVTMTTGTGSDWGGTSGSGSNLSWDSTSVYAGNYSSNNGVYNPDYSYNYSYDYNSIASTSQSNGIVVDMKVNYQDSGIYANAGQQAVSWTAQNATYCITSSSPTVVGWNNNSKSISGVEMITISTSSNLTLKCYDVFANYAEDNVRVNIIDLFNPNANYSNLIASTTGAQGAATVADNSGIAQLASSTTASSTYASSTVAIDPIAAQATALDHIQVIYDPQHCGYPVKNFLLPTYSYSNHEAKTYTWVMGESELIDNMAGAVIGNILNGSEEDQDAEDATFSPPFGIPWTGMLLYAVVGTDEDCAISGGDRPKILRAYLTAQDREWVQEQETSTSTSSSGSSLGF